MAVAAVVVVPTLGPFNNSSTTPRYNTDWFRSLLVSLLQHLFISLINDAVIC